jgi:hypothetical protein
LSILGLTSGIVERMKFRELAARVALVSISLMFSIGVGEIFLARSPRLREIARPYRERLADANVDGEPYLETGDDSPYTTRKSYRGRWSGDDRSTITTNPQGFRTTPALRTHVVARADVLCMGDSFTFGYLLDDAETWPAVLGSLYADRGLTVVNAGYTGGFSFDGAALHYRRVLSHLGPGTVIYAVFPDNDISDIGNWSSPAINDALTIRTTSQLLNEQAWRWPLLRESRLFVGLSYLWHRQLGQEFEMAEALRWPHANLAIKDLAASTTAGAARLIFLFLRPPNEDFVNFWGTDKADAWKVYREGNISILKAILTQAGVEWYDDQDLLEELHAGLRARRMPPLPKELSDSVNQIAEKKNWEWRWVLGARDGIHYSALTNLYVAAWIQGLIDSKSPARRPDLAPPDRSSLKR